MTRWPPFPPEAIAAGRRRCSPCPGRSARYGALTRHRDRPGPLGEGLLADAVASWAPALRKLTLPSERGPMPPAGREAAADVVARRLRRGPGRDRRNQVPAPGGCAPAAEPDEEHLTRSGAGPEHEDTGT